ncbi:MAG: hypothetical protein RR600_01155 [Aurantimicrobium sp.]|uniref:hypothetical protein n=1 Tax=Aurantimicrobium sp. TaxID=1930784 RepID=UPI00321F6874
MRVKPLIAIPLIAIVLAGCSAQTPAPQETTAATEQKPLFATDAEALAATEAAYANYLEVSDQIARDGGANPERLKGLVSDALYKDEVIGFQQIAQDQSVAVGASNFDTVHLQGYDAKSVSTYLCIDHSQIHLQNRSGEDVTSPNRVDRYPLVVTFSSEGNGNLKIESSETWSGQNFC